jgi:hypothetical protein
LTLKKPGSFWSEAKIRTVPIHRDRLLPLRRATEGELDQFFLTKFFENFDKMLPDHLSIASFDVVALNKMHELTILKQRY